jgi:hypothetical protein
MMRCRKLRKVESRSNALMSMYECDSCLWVVNLFYERNFAEVQLKFDGHDCSQKPLRQKQS